MAIKCSLDEIAVQAKSYDVIGITSVSTFALRVFEIIQKLKSAGIQAPIVVGGSHATILPESCLINGADFVIVGEGELPMRELVDALESGSSPDHIAGLAYRKDGKIIKNKRSPFIEKLDSIPIPAYDLLPMHKYKSSEARSRKQPSYSLMTSRGCPGVCSFCNKSVSGTKVRYFSAERIVDEFFLLRDKYGAQDIAIWDDNFLTDHDLVDRVCDMLIRRNFNRTFSVEARADHVTMDILKRLKSAGCDFIAYGIESGSQRMLDIMHKRITLDQVRKAVTMTKKLGINIRGYFLMGLPYETIDDMKNTIEFAIELDIEVASFTIFVPLPGTLDYKRALKSGYFPDPEYYLHRVYPEFNFPDSLLYVPEGVREEELLSLHKAAYNKYYFRPKFLLKNMLTIRTLSDVKRYVRGGINLAQNALFQVHKNG